MCNTARGKAGLWNAELHRHTGKTPHQVSDTATFEVLGFGLRQRIRKNILNIEDVKHRKEINSIHTW